MASAESQTQATLIAHYTSPQDTRTFSHPLNASSDCHSTGEKVAYLSTVRKSVSKLQEEVNVFLTQAMECDKAGLVEQSGGVDDKKEEDSYGEEMVDDEETTTGGP
ncbi:hypothetical protein MMC16_007689 [Acarospora aff. strigata]|nr:hypothetical protein [Acarospora aff. strigata]